MNADVVVVDVAPNMDDDAVVCGSRLDLDSLMIKLVPIDAFVVVAVVVAVVEVVVHSINHKVIYPN